MGQPVVHFEILGSDPSKLQSFYVEVPDVEAAQAEGLGGTRVMGPMTVMEGVELGLFADPEGHPIGVAKEYGQS